MVRHFSKLLNIRCNKPNVYKDIHESANVYFLISSKNKLQTIIKHTNTADLPSSGACPAILSNQEMIMQPMACYQKLTKHCRENRFDSQTQVLEPTQKQVREPIKDKAYTLDAYFKVESSIALGGIRTYKGMKSYN